MNLAVRLLYALNRHHKGLQWCEFTIKEDPDAIADYCKAFDVVAFSCYIWNITRTLEVCRRIKERNPKVKILLGGPEVSYDYQELMEQDEVDFIISGEGEIPFRNFMSDFPQIEKVPGLIYKLQGKVQVNLPPGEFDLKEYAEINPYAFDDPETLINKVCYVETSRGCPYKCEFCLASLDNKVRYLPIDRIKENLLYLMQHGRTIKFLDRTFNVKKDFTIDMFQFILDHHRPGNIFQFEITADIVRSEIVDFIKQHVPKGLFRFEIGIQTVNQDANKMVSRNQNFEKTAGVIKELDAIVEMHLDLIIGLPLDYWSDIRHSVDQVFALHPSELQLGFLKFLKGTPVRQKYEQHGYVFDPEPPYQIIQSNYLSGEELQQLSIMEEALELYWNKKRAVHTLKYIAGKSSIFDFLLELSQQFHQRSDFHKHSLRDAYDILFDFVRTKFPDDQLLHELVALDYYLTSKIKPQVNYLEEINLQQKRELISLHQLNHHQFRFIILPVSFDFRYWQQHGKIIPEKQNVIIQYSGTQLPQVVNTTEGEELMQLKKAV
ncbi:MAG: DUF4080 domain-containing protein [Bacteroidia bacterium]|jgi:radical SAM superfamily enzyme YgiQ (UPF0313 family)